MTHATLPSDDDVLTVPETAAMTRLSEFTLLRKRKEPNAGGLPFVQLSANRIGYIRRDVRAFIAARRVGVVAEAA